MRITAGDLTFSADIVGQGAPLVFVHGFPLDRRMWNAQIADFASTRQVIAPDLRGFGGTSPPVSEMTMETYADDLIKLLDVLAPGRRVALCGLSMGGYVALAFARRHRDRLDRLILCDTKAAGDTPAKAAERRRLAEEVLSQGTSGLASAMPRSLLAAATGSEGSGARSRAALIFELAAMIGEASPAAVAAALRAMADRPDSTDLLPTLDLPALVLCGEADTITPPAEMKAMADRLPNATFVTIARAGHLAPMENPTAVNAAIGRFLGVA